MQLFGLQHPITPPVHFIELAGETPVLAGNGSSSSRLKVIEEEDENEEEDDEICTTYRGFLVAPQTRLHR